VWTASHAPPQSVPSVAQALRPPRGAPATGEQVPSCPLSAQASHWPLQVVSQQTPSTQKPLAHWSVAEQSWPGLSLGTQTPPEHQSPETQSVSAWQLPVQAFAPQT
jgi:hypothetical protein